MRIALSLCLLVVLLFIGGIQDRHYQPSIADPQIAEGVITGWDQDRTVNKKFRPVVRFVDAAGNEHQFTNSRARPMMGFAIGSRVSVTYSRSNPAAARVNHWWLNNKNLLIFGALGLAALVASVVTAAKSGRRLPGKR
jgi:hypothetical protein